MNPALFAVRVNKTIFILKKEGELLESSENLLKRAVDSNGGWEVSVGEVRSPHDILPRHLATRVLDDERSVAGFFSSWVFAGVLGRFEGSYYLKENGTIMLLQNVSGKKIDHLVMGRVVVLGEVMGDYIRGISIFPESDTNFEFCSMPSGESK